MGNDEERHNCDDCGCGKAIKCDCYWLCGGEGAIYFSLCILIGMILLVPFWMFAVIATPFWLLAQCTVSRLNAKVKYWIIVVIFLIALIPPFLVWFLVLHSICHLSVGGTHIMCLLWSVVATIYE